MRSYLRPAVFVICVVLSVASIANVYSDNADVEALARKVACEPETTCAGTVTFMSRTPFSQTFELAIKKSSVRVTCTRSAYLFGDYACVK